MRGGYLARSLPPEAFLVARPAARKAFFHPSESNILTRASAIKRRKAAVDGPLELLSTLISETRQTRRLRG